MTELNKYLDQLFIKERHGIETQAVLREVRRHNVVLQCPERQDRYRVDINTFLKFYRLAS